MEADDLEVSAKTSLGISSWLYWWLTMVNAYSCSISATNPTQLHIYWWPEVKPHLSRLTTCWKLGQMCPKEDRCCFLSLFQGCCGVGDHKIFPIRWWLRWLSINGLLYKMLCWERWCLEICLLKLLSHVEGLLVPSVAVLSCKSRSSGLSTKKDVAFGLSFPFVSQSLRGCKRARNQQNKVWWCNPPYLSPLVGVYLEESQ